MKPLQLDLQTVVARCPADWTIDRLSISIAGESIECAPSWVIAVIFYRIHGAPYGDSPHGLLRFMGERRG